MATGSTSSSGAMRFSAVLIVRDEAAVLGRCLDSLRNVVDEMVVVDTGSTDETRAIAAAHGARVHDFPWLDDFAAARNFALAQASFPVALIIDADEYLVTPVTEARERLQAFAASASVHALGLVAIVNERPVESLEQEVTDQTARLFFRESWRYEGAVHEQLVARETGAAPVAVETGLRLRHTGYALGRDAAAAKAHRNIALLRKELARHPDDEYFQYQLAKAWQSLGRHKAAAVAYQRALRCIDFSQPEPVGRLGAVGRPVLTGLLCGAAYAQVESGACEAAAALLEQHRELGHAGTHRADFHHARGYAWLQCGDLARAESAYRDSFGLPEDVAGTGSFASWYHLGLIDEARNQPREALAKYHEALRLHPAYLPARDRIHALEARG
jgi:tetratricopeptide (TPR) repeat protein